MAPALLMLIVVLLVAGAAQGACIASNALPALAVPLDGGLTFRGHRLFGDNKTVRGALVMIGATTIASALLFPLVPPFAPPPAMGWAGLGALMGFAYILAELPNSFLKRQLGIEPGQETTGSGHALQYAVDQGDSVVGVVVALALVTDIPGAQLAVLAIVGTLVHAVFDLGLHRVGIKDSRRDRNG